MPRTKQFHREEVLQKAMELFWEKGFYATSMQDLVDKLGINRASIYDTFGSKRELFDLSIDKYKAENAKRVADFLYQYVNVRQGLYELFNLLINDAMETKSPAGCFVINTIGELQKEDNELKEKLNDNKEAFEKIYIEYLKYGVYHSQISPYKNLQEIASYLYTLQSGLRVVSKVKRNREELQSIVNTGLSILN